MTLAERLEKFPQMYSHDAIHWLADPVKKEAICLEAAARILKLEEALRQIGKYPLSRHDELSPATIRAIAQAALLESK